MIDETLLDKTTESAKGVKRSIQAFYRDLARKFNDKCRDLSIDLSQNKIDINDNDALAEKAFFALLADLLNCFKKHYIENRKDLDISELLDELKDNEKLTKQKLLKFLYSELQDNKTLSQESKDGITKLLDSEYGSNFATELLGSKIMQTNNFMKNAKELGMDMSSIKDGLDKIGISTKDVQGMTAGSKQAKEIKETLSKATELVKNAIPIAKNISMKK